MDLSNVVADERFGVFSTFINNPSRENRLREYLDVVRDVGVALLDYGRRAKGHDVTTEAPRRRR